MDDNEDLDTPPPSTAQSKKKTPVKKHVTHKKKVVEEPVQDIQAMDDDDNDDFGLTVESTTMMRGGGSQNSSGSPQMNQSSSPRTKKNEENDNATPMIIMNSSRPKKDDYSNVQNDWAQPMVTAPTTITKRIINTNNNNFPTIGTTVYVCIDHDCDGLVAPVSVVVANSINEAYQVFDSLLLRSGFKSSDEKKYNLKDIDITEPRAYILSARGNGPVNDIGGYEGGSNALRMARLKVYTCTDHFSKYPVPAVSLVVANDRNSATLLLNAELKRVNCEDYNSHAYTINELDTSNPNAFILSTGTWVPVNK
jgi:hypothetical protein